MTPIRAVVVGAGHRGRLYAEYARLEPTELIITAVVDPDPVRRDRMAADHGLPPERRFATLDDLPEAGVVADVAIDATMILIMCRRRPGCWRPAIRCCWSSRSPGAPPRCSPWPRPAGAPAGC